MITRIPQRTKDDCTICVVAMVMGAPYTYERVLEDSSKYPKSTPDGKFPAWWETYLREEGFDFHYCRFNGLYALPDYGGIVLGMLGKDLPRLKAMHFVAVEELGVVGSADNAPGHISTPEYGLNRRHEAGVVHDQWLSLLSPRAS